MEDKLCLKWNDFQENISTSFGKLRQDNNFSDVTLVCEDGDQVDSHKVILAAFSPFFAKLLERNDHPRPMIYMRGIKKVDLSAVIDFLYYGEANILQKNLEPFLAIAEDLKVKGLQQDNKGIGKRKDKETGDVKENETGMAPHLTKPSPKTPSNKKEKQENNSIDEIKCEPVEDFSNVEDEQTGDFSDQLEKHQEKVNSMLEKSQNHISNGSNKLHIAYSCKVCGKEGVRTNIKKHIEGHHMENISLNCSLCEKNCSSMTALAYHKKTSHSSAHGDPKITDQTINNMLN